MVNQGCCAAGRGSTTPGSCRSAYRYGSRPGNRYNDFDFRVCCLPQD
jgi:formylglycine-generating enzyme required for sulfatase activity